MFYKMKVHTKCDHVDAKCMLTHVTHGKIQRCCFICSSKLLTPGLQLTVWVSLLSSNQLVLSSVVSNCKCLTLVWNQYLFCLCISLGHSDIVTPLYFQFSHIFDIFVFEVPFENVHANIYFLKSTKSSLSPKTVMCMKIMIIMMKKRKNQNKNHTAEIT